MTQELVQGIVSADRRALARAITLVENDAPQANEIIRELYPRTGTANLIGITGAPGVGKSSLIGAMITSLRAQGTGDIGVVSVDPSSPFTHGALLGDRIRLSEHFLDSEVFIRSMGTRGHLGGLAAATLQVALLLDAFGKREILLETVGVGQSEVEIASIADTVVLVLIPGSGDSVQALKAGIMEIPDIIVINKSDHPATNLLRQQVRSILTLEKRDWVPPIVETQANTGAGIENLWKTIADHREYMGHDDRFAERRRHNLEAEVFSIAADRASRQLRTVVATDPRLRELLEMMHRREIDPLSCVNMLFDEVFQR